MKEQIMNVLKKHISDDMRAKINLSMIIYLYKFKSNKKKECLFCMILKPVDSKRWVLTHKYSFNYDVKELEMLLNIIKELNEECI